MESLVFSLNATIPVFLVIMVGYILKRIGWINKGFIDASNKINFKLTLPVLLIQELSGTDFVKYFDFKYVLFCAIVTTISIMMTWAIARKMVKDKSIVGEFVQGSYRSSAAVLGAAFAINMYGNVGMVPLMIIGAVPLYNIFAVIILTVECPEKTDDLKSVKDTFIEILKNPIIIGIVIGIILSILKIDFPTMVDNTVSNIAKLATPLALLSIGGGFEFKRAIEKIEPTVSAAILKLLGWALLFMPIAVLLGFRGEKLMAIIIMLGSPTTPSCYIMARNMKSEGTLTSGIVVLTTLLSAFSLLILILIARVWGWL